MTILLKRILEQQGTDGQFYDLGKDFANFKRTIDGTFEQVKAKYEHAISLKLNGKRIRARASRGYKQYIKDYEFDVTKITLDDYYDNYVVVAHDNSSPKPKEYFLKPGFKIVILGQATGQPSPQKGGKPDAEQNPSESPSASPKNPIQPSYKTPSNSTTPPVGHAPSNRAVDEEKTPPAEYYDAYPIDDIADDVQPWIPKFLIKPETPIREFIKGLGWVKKDKMGNSIIMFDLKMPTHTLKVKPSEAILKDICGRMSKQGKIYELFNIEFDKEMDEWHIRIKKTTSDNKSV